MKVRRSTRTSTVAATSSSVVLDKLNGMLERTFSSETLPSTRELRPSTIAKTRRSIENAIKREEVLQRKREARRSRQEGLIEVAPKRQKLAQPRRRTINKIAKKPEKLTQENVHSHTAAIMIPIAPVSLAQLKKFRRQTAAVTKIPKQPEKLVQKNRRSRSTAIVKITKQPVKRDQVKRRSRTVGQVIKKKAPRTRTFAAPRRRKEPLIFGPETEVVTSQTRFRSRTAGAPSSPRRKHIITITVNNPPAPQEAMETRRSRTSADVSQAQRQEEKEDAAAVADSFAEAWNWSFHPETYDGYVAPVEQARLEVDDRDAEDDSLFAQMMMDVDSFTDFNTFAN